MLPSAKHYMIPFKKLCYGPRSHYLINLGGWEQMIWILKFICLNSPSVWALMEFMWSESIHSSAETRSPFPEGTNWCIRQKSVTLTAKGKGQICLVVLIRSHEKPCMTKILKTMCSNLLGEEERYIVFFHFTDYSGWAFQQIAQNIVI